MSTLATAVLTGSAIDDRVSPQALLAAVLRFEVALARAQAAAAMIPAEAADAIEAAAADFTPDVPAIVAGGHGVGTPIIAFLEQLGAHVERRRPGSRAWLHHGATSQDALDSGMVLALAPLVREAVAGLARARAAAGALARAHDRTPILARTLLQAAGVSTFGFKAAQWGAAAGRAARRLAASADRGLSIQLAGAVGTGQAFSENWPAIQRELARALDLGVPRGGSWQSARDDWTDVLAQMAIATGVAAKIAGDVALMSQSEIGEVSEPRPAGAMSSAMPHKQNPVLAMRIRACAHVVNGHAAALLGTLGGVEHERGLGAWQAELGLAPALVAHALSAVLALATLLDGLQVHPDRALANIERTRGLVFADRAVEELSAVVSRERALAMVERACADAQRAGKHLREVLAQDASADQEMRRAGDAVLRALDRAFDPGPHMDAATRAAARALADTD
jgi:3-carboxy-cis,cis-muconate cycloisomerase